jgi:hypothetical protein
LYVVLVTVTFVILSCCSMTYVDSPWTYKSARNLTDQKQEKNGKFCIKCA